MEDDHENGNHTEAQTLELPRDLPVIPGYRTIRVLGEGGMGRVYLAEDLTLGRPVAIKVVLKALTQDPGSESRFLREARAMASVEHPNIVRVYAFGRGEHGDFLVMEYVDGESLDRRIRRVGRLQPGSALQIVRQCARALDAGWKSGLIHRDIKPSNILLDAEDRVMVADFGLAKSIAPSDQEKTQGGKVVGTPQYMSPEQARGEKVDSRSDIYSLGIVLFEMLTGARPFGGDTPFAVVEQQLNAPLPPLRSRFPDLPEGVVNLCEWMAEKKPAARPESYGDIESGVGKLLAGSSLSAHQRPRARSIAVLPFADMSREKDQEYFCEGIAEELINALVRIEDLSVASRTSAFQFRDAADDIREIGRRLNVDSVLEGSLRKAGETIRISAQLIDVTTGYHLWSERYERKMRDIFEVQDEITQSIVSALEMALTQDQKDAIRRPGTRDVRAYDFYLRGRKYFEDLTGRSLGIAREMFTRAVETDPGYALAHTGISYCCSFLYMYVGSSKEDLSEADRASTRALELEPELAEAHVARGLALSLADRFPEAETHFETAINLSPNLFDPHYYYGRACFSQGHMEKAACLFEEAYRIRPDSYLPMTLLHMVYEKLGRHSEAESVARRTLALIQRHLELNPDDARALYTGAQNALRIGKNAFGLELAQRVLALGRDDPSVLYNVACIFSLAGESDEAIDLLDQAVATGFAHRNWAEQDTDLDPIRHHPRFEEVLQKIP